VQVTQASTGFAVTCKPFDCTIADDGTNSVTVAIGSGITEVEFGNATNGDPPLTITTNSLADGTVGVAYSQTLAATGGTGPYMWRLASGRMPFGLTLNPTTGEISGTSTIPVAGSYLTFQVTDAGSPVQTAAASFTLVISVAPLVVATTSLSNGVVGAPYSQTLAATGGTAPYLWALTSGVLPAGLTLDPSGVIYGTPTRHR